MRLAQDGWREAGWRDGGTGAVGDRFAAGTGAVSRLLRLRARLAAHDRRTRHARPAGVTAAGVDLAAVRAAAGSQFGFRERSERRWAPLGVAVVAGAFMFGLGMQLAGGCGSGTLYKADGGMRVLVVLGAACAGLQWLHRIPESHFPDDDASMSSHARDLESACCSMTRASWCAFDSTAKRCTRVLSAGAPSRVCNRCRPAPGRFPAAARSSGLFSSPISAGVRTRPRTSVSLARGMVDDELDHDRDRQRQAQHGAVRGRGRPPGRRAAADHRAGAAEDRTGFAPIP